MTWLSLVDGWVFATSDLIILFAEDKTPIASWEQVDWANNLAVREEIGQAIGEFLLFGAERYRRKQRERSRLQ